MTHEELQEIEEHYQITTKGIMNKVTDICKTKKAWSLVELCEIADIIKDLSETHKNIAKVYYLMSEKSLETF